MHELPVHTPEYNEQFARIQHINETCTCTALKAARVLHLLISIKDILYEAVIFHQL